MPDHDAGDSIDWRADCQSYSLVVKSVTIVCSSKVNLTGVNGNVIMSRCGDDKAKTAEPAQAVHDRYRPEHNWGFSKPARAKPAWRKTSSGRLDRALCFKQRRTVANDNTVTFDGVIFRIP